MSENTFVSKLEILSESKDYSRRASPPPSSLEKEFFCSSEEDYTHSDASEVEEEIKRLESFDFAGILLALKQGKIVRLEERGNRGTKRPIQSDSEELSDSFVNPSIDEDERSLPSAAEEDHHLQQWDEEDDEWMVSPRSTSHSSKIARKKAPSGSACEKHKRWKKRCPDDCPMRSHKAYAPILHPLVKSPLDIQAVKTPMLQVSFSRNIPIPKMTLPTINEEIHHTIMVLILLW
jgi:hypothetical protein